MRPFTYTADTKKIRGRVVQCGQGVIIGMLLIMLSTSIAGILFESRLGVTLVLPGLVIVAVSAVLAIRWSHQLNAAKNLLSVDRDGMTLVQRGRTRHCRWTDISPVRLHSRFATFTLDTSGGRSDGRIDDIYPTPLAEIVAHINGCRERASAAEATALESQGTQAAPKAPTIFPISLATQTRLRRKVIVIQIVSLILIPLTLVTIGIDILLFRFSGFDLAGIATRGLIASLLTITYLTTFFGTGRHGNFLQVTDEGLTWSQKLTVIRQWKWQDVSSFEVRDGAGKKSPGGRTIVFMAADDGKPTQGMALSNALLARPTSPGLMDFALDDTYDAPLDRIAEHMNASRDHALAESPSDRIIELPSAGTIRTDGRPVRFQQDLERVKRIGEVGSALIIGCIVWLPIIGMLTLAIGFPGDMDGWAQSSGQWLRRFLVMLAPIGLLAGILFLIRELLPTDNTLTLNKYGLTLTRGGRDKVWAWRDLSDFAVEARRVLGLFGPHGVIVFEAPGGRDLRSRFLRWCYRLTGRTPAIIIEDVYNTPIDTIAETLSRYRSGDADGGPGAVPAE